jgi:hypothetical protein
VVIVFLGKLYIRIKRNGSGTQQQRPINQQARQIKLAVVDVEHLLQQIFLRRYLIRTHTEEIEPFVDTSKPINKKAVERFIKETKKAFEKDEELPYLLLTSYTRPSLININTAKEVASQLDDEGFDVSLELHRTIFGYERIIVVKEPEIEDIEIMYPIIPPDDMDE